MDINKEISETLREVAKALRETPNVKQASDDDYNGIKIKAQYNIYRDIKEIEYIDSLKK